MDNEPNISNSEKYRQKRKERITKSNEKKDNQSPKSKKSKKITAISIATVAVAVVVVLLLNFFGIFTRSTAALTTSDGTKVSIAEYEYYYRYFLSTYHNTAMQYEQSYGQYYGAGAGVMMTGYDYTKTPDKQKYELSELDKKYGKKPTWANYFQSISIQSCYMNRELAKEAKKNDIKLSKDEKKEVDDYIEEIRKTAAQNDFSLDAYLRENFGKGMNESLMRELFEIQTLAQKYTDSKSEEFRNSVKDEDVNKEYENNKDKYDVVDIRYYSMSSKSATTDKDSKKSDNELKAETKKDADKVKSNAQSMLNSITDENSFKSQVINNSSDDQKKAYEDDSATLMSSTSKVNIESSVSKEAADWIFGDNRKSGDKKVFTVENEDGSVNCSIVYVVKPQYQDNTLQPVNVRHILVAFDDNLEDGKDVDVTQDLKDKKKKVADDIFKKWKDGKATEESFSKLAQEKSSDTGSAKNGGLVEDVKKGSQFVKPFIDWCIKDGRKVGDTGIIESSFGYHIMYCTKVSKVPEWKTNIKNTLAESKDNKFFDDFMKKAEKKVVIKDKKINKANKTLSEVANNLIANTVQKETAAPQQANTKEEKTTKKEEKATKKK